MDKNFLFQNRQRAAIIIRRIIEPARKFAEHPQIIQRVRHFEALCAESPFGEAQRAVDVKH